MIIHTYILLWYLAVLYQVLVLNIEIAPLNNKQKRSPNFQFIPSDRRLFNMLEVIREIPSEKDAEARPVLGYILEVSVSSI